MRINRRPFVRDDWLVGCSFFLRALGALFVGPVLFVLLALMLHEGVSLPGNGILLSLEKSDGYLACR